MSNRTLALLGNVLWTRLHQDDGACYPRWIDLGTTKRLALGKTDAGYIWADTAPVDEQSFTARYNPSRPWEITRPVGDKPECSRYQSDN